MYKKILIALALDQGHAPRAFEVARKLKSEGGKLIAVHVIENLPASAKMYISEDHEEKMEQTAKQGIIDRIGEQKDVEAVVLRGQPGRTVTDYAKKIGADLIIAGSHEPGLTDIFIGSTAARIMHHANCSVHILREVN